MKAFIVRLPDETMARLREEAQKRGQSMNTTLNVWVELQLARAAERDEEAA